LEEGFSLALDPFLAKIGEQRGQELHAVAVRVDDRMVESGSKLARG